MSHNSIPCMEPAWVQIPLLPFLAHHRSYPDLDSDVLTYPSIECVQEKSLAVSPVKHYTQVTMQGPPPSSRRWLWMASLDTRMRIRQHCMAERRERPTLSAVTGSSSHSLEPPFHTAARHRCSGWIAASHRGSSQRPVVISFLRLGSSAHSSIGMDSTCVSYSMGTDRSYPYQTGQTHLTNPSQKREVI